MSVVLRHVNLAMVICSYAPFDILTFHKINMQSSMQHPEQYEDPRTQSIMQHGTYFRFLWSSSSSRSSSNLSG